MKLFSEMGKRLPYPLLCRLYHYRKRHYEAGRAAEAAARSGLLPLNRLDLLSIKKSETLFILGSAWSINNIPQKRWDTIAKHDSVGLNYWPVHPFVPTILLFEDMLLEDQPAMYRALHGVLERRAEEYAHVTKIVTEIQPLSGQNLTLHLPEKIKQKLYVGFSMPVPARDENELRRGIGFMKSAGAFTPRRHIDWLFKYGGSVIAMMTLGVIMGHRRIVLCGVDLNRQEYFYQHEELYPESAAWQFVTKQEPHLTARRLPWLIPAQNAVYLFQELVLAPLGIELLVESRVSTLFPRVLVASEQLFDDLAR